MWRVALPGGAAVSDVRRVHPDRPGAQPVPPVAAESSPPKAPAKAPAHRCRDDDRGGVLVVDFYERWNPEEKRQPGERDLEQARCLVARTV